MKKFVSLLTAACSLLSVSVMFAACGHDCEFATEWSKDATHHWHACAEADCEEVADKAEHTWDAGTVTTPATLTTKGVKTYTCTACAQTKTEEYEVATTVTAEQFAAAFDFGTNWTFTFDMTESDGSVDHYETKLAGDLYSYYNVERDEAGEVEWEQGYYLQRDGEKVYMYEEETLYNETMTVKQSVSLGYEEIVNGMFEDLIPEDFQDFSLYAYDETTKSYNLKAPVTIYGTTVSSVSFVVLDGKLVSFSYTINMGSNETNTFEAVITYGDASVTLPTNIFDPSAPVTGNTVNAFQWKYAFDFTDKVCDLQVEVSATAEQGGVTMSINMFMQYVNTANVVYQEDTQTYTVAGQEQTSVTKSVYVQDGENYYEFQYLNDTWYRTTVTEDSFISAKAQMDLSYGLPFSYGDATYDAATMKYTIADIPASNENPEYKNIEIQFVDGKLVSLNYTMVQDGTDMQYAFTVSYTNVTASVPTDFVSGDAQSQPIS